MDSGGEASSSIITIKVKDPAGEEVQFKVKKDTAMKKIFTAFSKQRGVGEGAYTFLFDGKRVTDDHTPKMLEMEDGDQIDGETFNLLEISVNKC